MTDSGNLPLLSSLVDNVSLDEFIEPYGSVIDFLDSLQSWDMIRTDDPSILMGSSSIAELGERKKELQYREVWLRFLLQQTRWEIELLDRLCQSYDEQNLVQQE
ncbi:MAG: hypothetical protein KA717_22595 [Woronichinia naegeliana WA131]|jgi:hypothetical protein|uniref:Uncharacterized protein n=1 Tax=Woronichinia naegeliana WA131 TaxID=2824559 RepID=A0A977KUJ6_9CYAN|nr:MAG: hypothetical protein KA717_22595 [Woronichinia naegeliana WA131]